MSWFAILMLIIQYGPALFRLVKEIIDLIRSLRNPTEASTYHAELAMAVKMYRHNKDREPLHRLRDKLRKRCAEESRH